MKFLPVKSRFLGMAGDFRAVEIPRIGLVLEKEMLERPGVQYYARDDYCPSDRGGGRPAEPSTSTEQPKEEKNTEEEGGGGGKNKGVERVEDEECGGVIVTIVHAILSIVFFNTNKHCMSN